MDLGKALKNSLYSGIRVDFFIPDGNIIVEVHGIQHYQPSGFGNTQIETMKNYQKQISRDSKLRDVCEQTNTPYLEIAYNDSKEEIFRKVLQYK